MFRRLFFILLAAPFLAQAAGRPYAVVPFELHHDLVIVKTKLNGRGPFNLMVDTCSNPSVIDTETADSIRFNTRKGRLGVVQVGRFRAWNVTAEVSELDLVSRAAGIPVHGILGHSFLKNRIVQFDYPEQRFRLYRRSLIKRVAEPSKVDGRITIPFTYAGDRMLVEDVYVNGARVTALLGTGFNGAFGVLPSVLGKLNLEEAYRKATPKQSIGFKGVVTNRKGTIETVRIGDLVVMSPTVMFWGKNAGQDKTTYGLAIGNGFLKRYVVTIDYRKKMIALQRGKNNQLF